MATIQAKTSRGQKYWYIVESRRVNGKPRPIVLAYLGKADKLLKRLQAIDGQIKLKSYSHGAIAALLNVAEQLEIPSIINQYVKSPRSYLPTKPKRNHLTVGITLLLGAMERVCVPTSKRGWWNWAKTTSCEYLLRCALSRIDSQHFWDLMDALPVEAIPKIEAELLQKVQTHYPLEHDTLLFDTTNFSARWCRTSTRHCSKRPRDTTRQWSSTVSRWMCTAPRTPSGASRERFWCLSPIGSRPDNCGESIRHWLARKRNCGKYSKHYFRPKALPKTGRAWRSESPNSSKVSFSTG